MSEKTVTIKNCDAKKFCEELDQLLAEPINLSLKRKIRDVKRKYEPVAEKYTENLNELYVEFGVYNASIDGYILKPENIKKFKEEKKILDSETFDVEERFSESEIQSNRGVHYDLIFEILE